MPLAPGLARLRPGRREYPQTPSVPQYRVAATVLFALVGAVFGSWAARIPDVAAALAADPSTLGLALLCISLGALASMQLTGALCARYGAGLVSSVAAVLASSTLVLPGLSSSAIELGVALVLFGAATGTANVAANAVGVQVERAAGRPMLPSLHAGFSFGGLAGAAVGGLVASTVPTAVHLTGVGVVGLVVTAAIAPTLRARDVEQQVAGADPADGPRGARGTVLLLGVIAGCTAFGEGAVTDWGALHLRESLGAPTAVAAAGYAGFSLAMACGRLAGNRLLRTVGATRLVGGGAVLATAGALAVATVPLVEVVIAGFVLVGLGLANVFPVAIARAGTLAGSAGVALASTVGYTGLLGGPPLLGIVADAVGLHVAFLIVAALVAVGAVFAGHVGPAPSRTGYARRLVAPAGAMARLATTRLGHAARGHGNSLADLGAALAERTDVRRPHPGLEPLAA
ncbi:MFS transporter [Pseudonocardia kunmingensis]|uniref:Fucose permease n=1 Tax=Pseudonocardia kunmingensis TaxID=630975 RepID=A0A543DI08_9PSEU|nr:MFS transporter [Pseudonocardia kunmingensis]TQM08929.1 fucose permease [Pseudonocardia kunmingensis]